MREKIGFDDVREQSEGGAWGVKYERTVTSELIDEANNHLGYLGFIKIFEEAQRDFQEERRVAELLDEHSMRLFVRKLDVAYRGEAKGQD